MSTTKYHKLVLAGVLAISTQLTATGEPKAIDADAFPRMERSLAQFPQLTGLRRSFPLPTLRWGGPAIAGYAVASHAVQGGSTTRNPKPLWWWVCDARSGAILFFASTKIQAIPQPEETHSLRLAEQKIGGEATVAELAKRTDQIHVMLRVLMPKFLSGTEAPKEDKTAFLDAMAVVLPPEEIQWCNAIAPDFLTWLKK